MDRLYYLTDEPFEQINRWLPPEDSRRGRPPKVKNREALEGILHILRTGTPWRDLPKAYGPWHTIYMRWQRWINSGVWWNILMLLKRLKGVELKIVFLDSTVVRAHPHAAGAAKKKATRPWVAPAADCRRKSTSCALQKSMRWLSESRPDRRETRRSAKR